MGKLLLKQHVAPHIIDIVEKAERYCFIISPYFHPWKQLIKALELAQKRNVMVVFLVRDEKIDDENILDLYKKYNFDIYGIERLHAKIYLNEKEVLISSMNLYNYSQNNFEVGYLFRSNKFSRKIVRDVIINDMIKVWTIKQHRGAFCEEIERKFYCIRCKRNIEFNTDLPLCPQCYEKWQKYKNENYKETYCHKCGEEMKLNTAEKTNPDKKITFNRPLCDKCFAENRNWRWFLD
jgi:phosphatidylserine/phosphatidylglycerophosphate/cardiolipin synthase-like enzyme